MPAIVNYKSTALLLGPISKILPHRINKTVRWRTLSLAIARYTVRATSKSIVITEFSIVYGCDWFTRMSWTFQPLPILTEIPYIIHYGHTWILSLVMTLVIGQDRAIPVAFRIRATMAAGMHICFSPGRPEFAAWWTRSFFDRTPTSNCFGG